jgi:hypothetical protein
MPSLDEILAPPRNEYNSPLYEITQIQISKKDIKNYIC